MLKSSLQRLSIALVYVAVISSTTSFAMGKSRSPSSNSDSSSSTDTTASSSATPSGHACSRIAEGGYQKMEPILNYFDDIAEGEYLLIRKPTQNGVDQYDIVLNYQFNPTDPSIAEKTTACLNRYNPYLRGPNGEQITIRLPLPSDPALPKAHPVTVSTACTGNEGRGSALCWNPYYACSIVFHETMHHLGLVDEYAQCKCRSLGPVDSLMTNTVVAALDVLPTYRLHTYTCNFSGADQVQCLHALDLVEGGMKFTSLSNNYYGIRLDNGEEAKLHREGEFAMGSKVKAGEEYLWGTDGTVIQPNQENTLWADRLFPPDAMASNSDGFNLPDHTMDSLEKLAQQFSTPKRISPTQVNWVEVTPSKRKSILYPAEASTLLYGRCSVNETFLACEHGAYSDSFCGHKPDICGDGQPADAWVQLPADQTP